MSQLSPQEAENAIIWDTNKSTPLMTAVKRANMALVQVVLKWLPKEQVNIPARLLSIAEICSNYRNQLQTAIRCYIG